MITDLGCRVEHDFKLVAERLQELSDEGPERREDPCARPLAGDTILCRLVVRLLELQRHLVNFERRFTPVVGERDFAGRARVTYGVVTRSRQLEIESNVRVFKEQLAAVDQRLI